MARIAGAVPYEEGEGITPAEGVPSGDALRTQASPQDFGAQVGQQVEKAGAEQLDAVKQWGGLIAETQANQSEVAYTQAQGELRAKYSQYEGLQADKMRPQYEAESEALQAKFAANLSPIAAKQYDAITRRTMANDISNYAGYSATQIKQANVNSHKAIIDQTTAAASDPARVTDPAKFGADLGTLQHSANAQADLSGLTATATGFDQKTQTYTFPDTPEGNAQKASYQDMVDKSKTPYIVQAIQTMATTPGLGPITAAKYVQQYSSVMPPLARAKTQQYLAPKMMNQNIDQSIKEQDDALHAGWHQNVLNNTPSLTGKTDTPDVMDTIHQNEGFTGKIGTDSNGANVINGINEKAFPQDFATIKAAYEKSPSAGAAATNDFYQKNILDKYDIKSLPKNTQAIVADGLVNHGTGDFGQSLIAAAKNGASPQQLIDMRRAEYQRLADADTDGSKGYAKSLAGWNNRLDGLQRQQAGQPIYANPAEYLEANKTAYVNGAVERATKQYPNDLAIQQTAEKRAELNINAQIANAKAALKADTDTIDKAIGGSMTNGKVPMTLDELGAIKGVQPILDKVQREQGDYYHSITTRIAKAQHSDATTNSPNAYDAIMGTLGADDTRPYSRQEKVEYLSKGLGSDNPGYSISQKDFNDAKPAVDLNDGRSIISSNMKQIAEANGNLDGKGQERAVQWYNQTMSAWKANQSKETGKMSEADFFDTEKNKSLPPQPMPSRVQQLQNIAQKQAQTPVPVFTDKAQYDAAASGTIYIRNGVQYRKP